jgi:type IV pilus assembly protein PilW
MPGAGGAIPINANPAGFVAGDLLLISDCQSADAFAVGAVDATPSVTPAAALTKIYSTGAEVYSLVDTFYYVGTNPAGNRALYRIQNGAAAEELVENVEDMELRFGVDTNNDFAIDAYVAAGGVANWRQVLSVRLNLVFVSDNSVATGAQPYVVEGVTIPAADTRLRQVATATYGLRNRLP